MSGREWFITFGVEHPRIPHPLWGDADGLGWVTVVADSEAQARRIAFAWLGRAWSTIGEQEPRASMFTRGELRRIDVSSRRTADLSVGVL